MWLDKLKALKKETGTTNKYLADKMHKSERTIARFFSGETRLGIDEAREMALLMGSSLDEILDESDFKLPTPEIQALKNEIASLTKAVEELTSRERELKDEVLHLKAENARLQLVIAHKEEIIELHNYYNKIKPGN